MVVGLTGGIGSGKTTVAKIFKSLGVNVIDADKIARDLVVPGTASYQEIIDYFGKEILDSNGNLNRNKLRILIFENLPNRQWLESLLHPLIRQEILEAAKILPKGEYLVIEIPLLFETEFQEAVNRVLVVDCEESQQIQRVIERDNIPQDQIESIMKTQVNRNTRLKKGHDILENNGSLQELRQKVQSLHHFYSDLAKLK